MATVGETVAKHIKSAPATVQQTIMSRLGPSVSSARTGELDVLAVHVLLNEVGSCVKLFTAKDPKVLVDTLRNELVESRAPKPTQVTINVRSDAEVILATRECQRLMRPFFSGSDVVRATTAVSEFARNIYMYAKQGTVQLTLSELDAWIQLDVVASDQGPGIPNLDEILAGKYVSRTGLGRGLVGSKALLDALTITSSADQGTTVRAMKRVRRR